MIVILVGTRGISIETNHIVTRSPVAGSNGSGAICCKDFYVKELIFTNLERANDAVPVVILVKVGCQGYEGNVPVGEGRLELTGGGSVGGAVEERGNGDCREVEEEFV